MNRPEFETALARMRERIAELPEAQRPELSRLADETAARHDAISRSSLRAHRAAEQLELRLEQLDGACRRLAGLAAETRRTLARAQALRRESPGRN